MKSYDVVWLGTGQATGTVIPQLVRAGKKVAVIESGRFGGSCVNYGCTPTKTLVASARAAHMVRRAPEFGIEVPSYSVNFPKVMERMNHMRNGSSQGLENWLESMEGVELYRGVGNFVDSHTIAVGDTVIAGKTVVIHSGTRARSLDVPGLDSIPWLDSGALLELKTLPEHLVIVGGSYIGLEFAQVFARFGSKVTVLEAGPHITFREDPDIAEEIVQALEAESISIYTGVKLKSFGGTAGQVVVNMDHRGEELAIEGDQLLLGVGRLPNTEALNLAAAGVEVNGRGYIEVDDFGRTNAPHIYALGDVNGKGAFTHTSVNDGEVFLDHYFSRGQRKIGDRIPLYAMYTDPPLGRIGLSELEARKTGRPMAMATMAMDRISRAKEKSETRGLVKIIVDIDSRTIAGVSMVGVGADEIVNMFAPLMYEKVPVEKFRTEVLVHPTVAELMPWILDGLVPLN